MDQRDDLTIEVAKLCIICWGVRGMALDIVMSRVFHPWEGGEGKVTRQYVTSLIQLARAAYWPTCRIRPEPSICLKRARSYPHNLGEGKLLTVPENNVFYYLGLANELRGDAATAKQHYKAASSGSVEPASPRYYNDQPPESIFYQELGARKAGSSANWRDSIFQRLIEYGEEHLHDEVTMDYFAVSLPNFLVFEDDLTLRNHIHCLYLIALGTSGFG